jgi:hypothetical protein
MSDLEFQRELSSDQLREALSLLDRAAGMKPENLQVGDLSSAEGDPGADEACATMATQDRLPAVEDLQQRTKHLNLVDVTFWGLGIAAAATLMLLSRGDPALTPPSLTEIAQEQLPNQSPGQLVKSASPALPVANPPPDQGLGGSEQRPSTPEVTGSVGQANRSDDRPAATGEPNTVTAIPYAAQTATVISLATRQDWSGERTSRKPKGTWWHARTGRVESAKQRFSPRHWQARAELKCFFFVCWYAFADRPVM